MDMKIKSPYLYTDLKQLQWIVTTTNVQLGLKSANGNGVVPSEWIHPMSERMFCTDLHTVYKQTLTVLVTNEIVA